MTPIDRLPPHSIEAEEAVLGSILIDPEAVWRVSDVLRGEDFYLIKNQWVWESCQRLHQRRLPIDVVTLRRELEAQQQLDELGGSAYLTQLMTSVPTAIHAEGYGRIVAGLAERRRLLAAASTIAQLAYDESADNEAVTDQAERAVLSARRIRSDRTIKLSEALRQYYDQIEYRYEHRGELLGVPTGFDDLDRMTGGLQRSDMIVVAGRPGQGKTSLLLNIALNAAKRFQQRVAIFSLEMSHAQLTERLVAQEAGIDSQRLRTGDLRDEEWPRFVQAQAALGDVPIVIDDTPALSISQLRAKARRLDADHGLDLILVDYLQLMTTDRRSENRNQEVAALSQGLKNLARELNVPVVVASQLSRAVEQRMDKRPMLSDLRDSGAIEQDSDVVLFLYRDGAYHDTCETPNATELIVAKHRKGPTGTVNLFWQGHLTRFLNTQTREVQL